MACNGSHPENAVSPPAVSVPSLSQYGGGNMNRPMRLPRLSEAQRTVLRALGEPDVEGYVTAGSSGPIIRRCVVKPTSAKWGEYKFVMPTRRATLDRLESAGLADRWLGIVRITDRGREVLAALAPTMGVNNG